MPRLKTKKKLQKEYANWRINAVFLAFLALFMLVNLKLFKIQVLSHEKYESLAQDQYWESMILPAKRGNIISSDNFVLAGTRANYLLFGEPKIIENAPEVSHKIASLLSEIKPVDEESLGIDSFTYYYQKIFESLNYDLMWVPLQKNLTSIEKEKVEELEITGIGFEEEPIRYYPEETLASHVLGFVASDEHGEPTGYYGIEGSLNEDLKGRPGRIMEETDASGLPILMGSYRKIQPIPGREVVLTINRTVQYIVEKYIQKGVEDYDAVSGSIIVMDPLTGDVIAMANYPSYHPEKFDEIEGLEDEEVRRKEIERVNNSISVIYEPGSVMKPFTVSAALDLDIVTPTTTFEDNGPVRYSDYTINNWDGAHHGTQTIIQLLQKSNNIGAAWVGHQVGKDKLYKYLTDFGFGERTGIDLEGEDTGYFRDIDIWTDIDLATASFGQGISATPLQVLNSMNAIANGGYLLKPKIIYSVKDETKEIVIPTKIIRQVISEGTSETMIDLLELAVAEGEAKWFVSKDYRIAGKTGTAQIPEGGKYAKDRTNATFAGFMAGSKQFSMIVKLEEPQSSIYAAETAVPLWMEITNELVKYYGLVPDKSN